jgi:hypothetical protein
MLDLCLPADERASIRYVPGSSIPPLCDQPPALVFKYLKFLDRKLDRRLPIGLVMDDANEPSRSPAKAVNAPGVVVLLARRLAHREDQCKPKRPAAVSAGVSRNNNELRPGEIEWALL